MTFGGPIVAAQIMKEEFCIKRKWLTTEEFDKEFSLIKALPGPFATQLAIRIASLHLGKRQAVAAGIAYILPAFLAIVALGFLFSETSLPDNTWFAAFFSGLKISALAIVLVSGITLFQPVRAKKIDWILFLLAFAPLFIESRLEAPLLLGCALIGTSVVLKKPFLPLWALVLFAASLLALVQGHTSVPASFVAPSPSDFSPFTSPKEWFGKCFEIFWLCFRSSLLVFGSGLAIVPLLKADFVGRLNYITESDFLTGVTLGQMTPGPVVIAASYFGLKAMGLTGALLATVGIFLPGFFVMLTLYPKLVNKPSMQHELQIFGKFALPIVCAGILAVTLKLGLSVVETLPHPLVITVFSVSAVLLFLKRAPSLIVLFLSGVMAVAFQVLMH